MSIWRYDDTPIKPPGPSSLEAELQLRECFFCESTLSLLDGSGEPRDIGYGMYLYERLQICDVCGWWIASKIHHQSLGADGQCSIWRNWGVLRTLDPTDVSTPLTELRAYLVANFDHRFRIHPAKLEDIVGSIFSNIGYEVRVTSYSGDQGIDVFVFDGPGDDTIGIQVKRYQGRIEAEQIRSFVGALVLKGITRGIFVTTSEFQRGAVTAAEISASKGIKIDLWNADTFYDRLRLVQRSMYRDANDPTAPFFQCWQEKEKLPLVYQQAWGY
jgi:restriction system protein